MIRNRILLKAFAIFFLIEMFSSAVVPAVSWALTAGPTSPEAWSFEPVDTTDMVDLKTGDFNYNVPLLEVPGPAGGYPLSLSYHAGIQPNQEASWVGLGASLNPGSIARMVNGYPDDHNNVTDVDRSYWAGGMETEYQHGVSFGIADCATISLGLEYAQDTYRGTGWGAYIGANAGISEGDVSASVGVTVDFAPYGNTSVSAGIGLGIQSAMTQTQSITSSLNLSYSTGSNFGLSSGVSTGGYGGVSGSLLDASISSQSSSTSLSVGGGTAGVYNAKANHISIHAKNRGIDIPVWWGINVRFGRSVTRYWTDETSFAHTFGSLYSGSVNPQSDITAFDNFDIQDTNLDPNLHSDAEELLGGSLPDFDIYTVTGQGISGNIRPYVYQEYLYRQDNKSSQRSSYLLLSSNLNKPAEFRFINDFSNRLEYDAPDFNVMNSGISYDFSGNLVTGEDGASGYNETKNQLAGSKHVEWYSNREITNGTATTQGFINCTASGFIRDGVGFSGDQVGGFSITNSSGVTYHYALPAYSYNEEMKTSSTPENTEKYGNRYNQLKRPTKYAYTWFLTSVTGPDYVDRNTNGLADHGDFGYWVDFQYTQDASNYQWRNPGIGANKDLDNSYQSYSTGLKEIYYLSKIFTETHVAIFTTSKRVDGREASDIEKGGFEPVGTFVPRPGQKLDNIKLYNYDAYSFGQLDDSKILREIDFGYADADKGLCQGTPNSYDPLNPSVKLGKLTLTTLSFLGKAGVSLIPPMSFGYAKNPKYNDNVPANVNYSPDLTQDFVDSWGFYKSDFSQDYLNKTNDMIGRLTTAASAQNVDAWSLTDITTSVGASIKITYESDQYQDVEYENDPLLRIDDVTDVDNETMRITFQEQQGLTSLYDYYTLGDVVDIDVVGGYSHNSSAHNLNVDEVIYWYGAIASSGKVKISAINDVDKYIEVIKSVVPGEHSVYYKLFKGSKRFYLDYDAYYAFEGDDVAPDVILGGFISYIKTNSTYRYGGGLRTKSLEIINEKLNLRGFDGRKTIYTYESGKTPYEPFQILIPKIKATPGKDVHVEVNNGDGLFSTKEPGFVDDYFKKLVSKHFNTQIGLSRVVPGPGVMYRYVTVSEQNITSDGVYHDIPRYSKYEFQTFSKDMIQIDQDGSQPPVKSSIQGFDRAFHNTKTIKDFTSRVGSLISISSFDTKGTDNKTDDELISTTINNYLHDDTSQPYEQLLSSKFSNLGLIEETYTRAKKVRYNRNALIPYLNNDVIPLTDVHNIVLDNRSNYAFSKNENHLLATLIKYQNFPAISMGQVSTNYKTSIVNSSDNIAFDFYSGSTTEVVTTDSYGNRYLSLSVPAYRHYPGMGLKIENVSNANMLTQTAEQYSFEVDDSNNPTGVLSAGIQTWSDAVGVQDINFQPGVWRPQSTYIWDGKQPLTTSGAYPYDDFNLQENKFDFDHPDASQNWLKTGQITLYDKYTHALEASDLNGQYAATRMDNKNYRVIAAATHSMQSEFGCSGAEYYTGNTELEGGIARGDGYPSGSHVHSGDYSLSVPVGGTGFNFLAKAGKKYRATVWVYAPDEAETQGELSNIQLLALDGSQLIASTNPVLNKSKSKSWYLLNLDIPAGNEVKILVRNNSQRGVYFDDFRVYPMNATVISYVYDKFSGEVTYMLDANNFYTKFDYDAMGRLIRTSREYMNFDFGPGKESFRADATLNEFNYNYGTGK